MESRGRKYDVFKRIEKLISDMNYAVDAVVVEGPHDMKTLQVLGYRGPTLTCSRINQARLVNLIAERYRSIVILTDFDSQGRTLSKKLGTLLERRGLVVGHSSRRILQRLLKEVGLETIEGIYRLKIELFH
ncbi:MAG: toprim domain-containing protein [Candidatus Bathyarchaeia archaeon]